MPQNVNHLLEGAPLLGGMMARASSAGTVDIKGILTPVVVGIISALGSSAITTARLEERFIQAEARNAEFRQEIKQKLVGMEATDSDVRDRLTRIEVRQSPAVVAAQSAADRRPR